MRRITLWIVSTTAVVVLLFSYRTSTGSFAGAQASALAPATPGAATPQLTSPTAAPTPVPTTEPDDASSPAPSASATPSGATGVSGSFTGSSVDTRWGPVQVRVSVTGGRITDVQAVVYPQENPRDQEINAYALPVLHDEVVAAQSAQVDAVGGATVTSEGYLSSLQSALDAAHLGG